MFGLTSLFKTLLTGTLEAQKVLFMSQVKRHIEALEVRYFWEYQLCCWLYVYHYTGLLVYLWFDRAVERSLLEYAGHIVSMFAARYLDADN